MDGSSINGDFKVCVAGKLLEVVILICAMLVDENPPESMQIYFRLSITLPLLEISNDTRTFMKAES